ncbi:potassium-transporting ATPase subunit F [Argonema antarcticum]|uniref:potassium-transporting ATPase subunit F n=1 Tax=Argonema antarcticum TaxID=2942763 RepID=UPI002013A471|nr:potassium-transporting ATPase subunit F [Argonema antarcticum]MCL1474839.1 potassium-transporting ATPase subunit F [Argonema antarcticum A004/B2]
MKRIDLFDEFLPRDFKEGVELLKAQWRRRPLPIQLFLLMCLNLIIAPAVYAAAGTEIDRRSAWALGMLGLLTLGLSIYVFVVIFQPEHF